MTRGGRATRRALAVLVLLSATLLAGCLNPDPAVHSERASASSASGGSTEAVQGGVPESTVGVAPRIDEDPVVTADPRIPFVEATEQSGGLGYDADTVMAVRYGVHPGYERAVIDLGTGEEPAGAVPEWSLISPKGDGLLRVNLPSASATCVSDGSFGGGLLGGFHVVRAPEGGMFVDFFAHEEFRYRVIGPPDPARLVVDFQPTRRDPKLLSPAKGGDTVLVEPRSGARISDPLTVSGYARNPEAANTIILTGPRGKVLARRTVRSNDWSHTWGYFEATLDLPPLSGKGTLKVGAANASDGSSRGVEIPVWAR